MLDFLETWCETLDGNVLHLLKMKKPELAAVIEQRDEVDRGRIAHTNVLKQIDSEIPADYTGTVESFLKKNPASRSLIETIVNDYRKEYLS
jgi:hypothetical protein